MSEEQGWRAGKSANDRRKLKAELERQEKLRNSYEHETHENEALIGGVIDWHNKRWDKHPNLEDMDLKEQMLWFIKELGHYNKIVKHLTVRSKEISSHYEVERTTINTPNQKES